MPKSNSTKSTEERDRKNDARRDRAQAEEATEGRSLFEEIDLNLVPHV
jgi:hypothetical protein